MRHDIQIGQVRWHSRHTVLGICVGSYFAVRFAQLVISPVVPSVLSTFAVSRGAIGVVLTGMWVAYALTQLPSGVLSDRFGSRTVVLVALGGVGVAALGLSQSPSMLLFGAFVLWLGAGAGLYYNAATALLTAETRGTGRAIGIHRVGSQVAGLLAPVVAAGVGSRFGWRAAFLAAAAVAAVLLAVVRRHVRPAGASRPDATLAELAAPGELVRLLSRPPLLYTTLLATLGEFVMLATMSFLPTFLFEHHGLSLATAGLLFSMYFAIVALGQPLSGWFSDRLGRDRVVAVLFGFGVVGYGGLALTTGLPWAVPTVALVGLSMNWNPAVQSRAVDLLDDAERGTGFGLVRTGYLLVGALGPAAVGSVADAFGWAASFGVLAAVLALAVVSLVANRAFALGL